MKQTTSNRDAILAKLRQGRSDRKSNEYPDPEWESPVFPIPDDLLLTFKNELETIKGQVFIESSQEAMVDRLKAIVSSKEIESIFCIDEALTLLLDGNLPIENKMSEFLKLDVAITRCEQLVSRTGSVFVSSAHPSGRRLNVFPSLHIVWANASQLVPFVDDALVKITERYGNNIPSQITSITGPSRTADIEKTLVLGAHGPKELIVLINQNA